jgi:hypothetical protein
MGTSGDDAGCPARNHVGGDNGRMKLSAVKHSDCRAHFSVSALVYFEERA